MKNSERGENFSYGFQLNILPKKSHVGSSFGVGMIQHNSANNTLKYNTNRIIPNAFFVSSVCFLLWMTTTRYVIANRYMVRMGIILISTSQDNINFGKVVDYNTVHDRTTELDGDKGS